MAEIAAASQEQATGIEQVSKAMTQMDQVTQTNSAQTEELSSTAEELFPLPPQEQLQALTAPIPTRSLKKKRRSCCLYAPVRQDGSARQSAGTAGLIRAWPKRRHARKKTRSRSSRNNGAFSKAASYRHSPIAGDFRSIDRNSYMSNTSRVHALGEEQYGIEILRVQEIKGYSGITPIPNTPAHIRGVMNLRGTRDSGLSICARNSIWKPGPLRQIHGHHRGNRPEPALSGWWWTLSPMCWTSRAMRSAPHLSLDNERDTRFISGMVPRGRTARSAPGYRHSAGGRFAREKPDEHCPPVEN